MIIASNSEVKTIVMGVNLESDSYNIISQIQHEGYKLYTILLLFEKEIDNG